MRVMESAETVAENLRRVEERIARAAERSGRSAEAITLVLAAKTVSAERVRAAVEAGAAHVGENYVQEARAKAAALADLSIRWHMIGHLQTNKAKDAVALFEVIQSLDSARLARELSRRAEQAGRVVRALIEVNAGLEESKFGVAAQEVFPLLEQICDLPNLAVEGLMTLGPLAADAERARPTFVMLRELAEEIREQWLPHVSMLQLSMGMSADFEVAIEEGATIVRLGTAVFGPRG